MERYAGTRKVFLADGDPPELGRDAAAARTGAHAANARAATASTASTAAKSARRMLADVSKYGGDWTRGRPARLPGQGARADPHPLPRLGHRHRAAAVLGRRRAGRDPAGARRLGPGEARRSRNACTCVVEAMRRAYRDRGAVPRRSGFRADADRAPDQRRLRRRPARRRSSPTRRRRARRCRPATRRSKASTPRISRSSTPTATSPRVTQTVNLGLRLGHGRRRRRLPAQRRDGRFRAASRARRTPSA